MTKNLDSINDELTMGEVGDGLKAWLKGGEDSQEPPEAPQEPSQEPEEDTPQEDTADSPEAPQEGAQEEDATDTSKAPEEPEEDTPQEDTAEADSLRQAYAELQAKVAELEAREAARAEAAQKTEALAAAGIKGDYSALLSGPKDQWAGQIALLKEFAAENAPRVSVPRDPAVDADVWSEPKEITADEFLNGRRNDF